jgi:hypothetical protein
MCTRLSFSFERSRWFLPHLISLPLFSAGADTEFHVVPVFGRGLNGPPEFG